MNEQAGNALISVSDKTGIVEFAQGLAEQGWNIYASGGTAAKIGEAGVAVTDVKELVGGEAILGHRVVTLSREISAGILADKTKEQDMAELSDLGIPAIDLVCVDMYPLKKTIAAVDATEESVIDSTDIGGPTMLRAAAKGRRIVLSKAEQRQPVLDWLKAGRPDEVGYLKGLAATAELEVAKYTLESAKYLGGAAVVGFVGESETDLKYGENAWQAEAGLYTTETSDPLSLSQFEVRQGRELGYNNYADVDRLIQTVTHVAAGFEKNYKKVPAIAIGVKHGNACGAGVSEDPSEALQRMIDGDPRAIFGGSIMLNFTLDEELAEVLLRHSDSSKAGRLLDIVVAADITPGALKILERKSGRPAILTNPALQELDQDSLDQAARFRYVRGGVLAQPNYTRVLDSKDQAILRNGIPNKHFTLDPSLILGWAIGSTSNSNTITLIKNNTLIGNGVGQQDRVSAAELAIKRARDAGHDISGAVAYSDSFFPFPDGAQVLADAGVKQIFASRSSAKDADVAEAMSKSGVIFFTLPDADIRGFYAH